jgi:hypothetical protein
LRTLRDHIEKTEIESLIVQRIDQCVFIDGYGAITKTSHGQATRPAMPASALEVIPNRLSITREERRRPVPDVFGEKLRDRRNTATAKLEYSSSKTTR